MGFFCAPDNVLSLHLEQWAGGKAGMDGQAPNAADSGAEHRSSGLWED